MTERRDSRCQDQPGRTPAFIISERSKGFMYIWNKGEKAWVAIYFIESGVGIPVRGRIFEWRVDEKEIERLRRMWAK